ncbi:MAG: HAD superfamily hydrolase (TIGR01450 family) [Cyclobacteriaceae bacterium]|jgi:HAD superfamily hydrolase (TIGR01450 family)
MIHLESFKEVASKYETIFFDAFGVLKNHKGFIPGIEQTFNYLDEQGIDYYIVTNDASRGPIELAQSYQSNGIKQITVDRIISSGMLAREYLRLKISSGSIAYLGTKESAHYIETLGLKTISIKDVDLDHSDTISALVFFDDEGFDWREDINKAVNLLRKENIPTIVANTDISYPVSQHEVAVAAGGLAKMVETIVGKEFIRFGKPDPQMFMFAYEHAIKKGGTLNKRKILMVGDTLYTDIVGGDKFGLDTVLVLTGNTLAKNADMRINSLGIVPTYICESVAVQ